MEPVKEFWQINAGQIFSIFVFVAGAIAVWQKMRDKLESLEKITDRNTNDIESMTKLGIITTIQQHERRITQIESSILDLREMKTDLRWLKERMDKGT